MAYYDSTWYLNSVGYAAVTVRPQNTAVAAGVLRRQFTAPAVGSERVFVCIIAGTTANVTDATWVLTRGAKTTDGTATWQECTGAAAVNGDLTNTVDWTTAKAIGTPSLGAIIKRNNGASYWICSTAGTMGASEPAWANNTAGTTQADGTTTWTCLGVVGNFTGGQAPHARLQGALATNWFVSGNTIYVGNNHAESQAANMIMSPSSAAMTRVLCHNSSGSYPPSALTTGATITTVGNFSITFSAAGSFYFYGITFSSGVTNSSAIIVGPITVPQVQNWYYFDSCSFECTSVSGNSYIEFGNIAVGTWAVVILNNTTVKFATITQYVTAPLCQLTWQNTGPVLVIGSTVPNILFQPAPGGGNLTIVTLEALDLSQLTGSLYANPVISFGGSFTIKDCKLNAATTVTPPINAGMIVQLVRSDFAGTSFKSARYAYEGTETTETSIVRTSGAIDPTGQAQSRKIVTTVNAQWLRPFRAEPYAIWNDRTAANVVVTVYGTINAGAVPNNDDIWMEVEYLGSATDPLGKIVNTTKASVLAANAAVASDGSTWGGGGSGAGWSPFKLVATLSSPQPAMAGYLHARIRAAKASATYYIDPQVVLS